MALPFFLIDAEMQLKDLVVRSPHTFEVHRSCGSFRGMSHPPHLIASSRVLVVITFYSSAAGPVRRQPIPAKGAVHASCLSASQLSCSNQPCARVKRSSLAKGKAWTSSITPCHALLSFRQGQEGLLAALERLDIAAVEVQYGADAQQHGAVFPLATSLVVPKELCIQVGNRDRFGAAAQFFRMLGTIMDEIS